MANDDLFRTVELALEECDWLRGGGRLGGGYKQNPREA